MFSSFLFWRGLNGLVVPGAHMFVCVLVVTLGVTFVPLFLPYGVLPCRIGSIPADAECGRYITLYILEMI